MLRHALQEAFLAHARHLHDDRAGLIHRSADDRVAHRLFGGDGFARHQTLIDTGVSLQNFTVHGNLFARPHAIAFLHFINWYLFLSPIAKNVSRWRLQIEQLADRLRCARADLE